MAPLSQHQSSNITKLIVVGDPGVGKTGALTSLLHDGYKIWLLDTDGGIDILHDTIRNDPKLGESAIDNVDAVTLQNAFRSFGDKIISKADGWSRLTKLLVNWDNGPRTAVPGAPKPADWIYTLGPKDVFVIDSLSGIADIAMDQVLSINGRLGTAPFPADWRDGQDMIQNFMRCVMSDQMKGNVIVNAHIVYVKTEDDTERGYPATLGKALSPKIGRHFNSVLHLKRSGVGARAKREFFTNPQGVVEVKNSAPFSVKQSYSIETGLAEFFRDVRGGKSEKPALTSVK